jgi:hypothetical protein
MRVKLIGVSDEARKSESVARGKRDRDRLIATFLTHIGEAVRRQCGRHLNAGSPHLSSVNSLKRQMTLKEAPAEISENLEYPACPLCGSDRREFPFRLHEPYTMALRRGQIPLSLSAADRKRNSKGVSATVVVRRRRLWLRGTSIAAPAAER